MNIITTAQAIIALMIRTVPISYSPSTISFLGSTAGRTTDFGGVEGMKKVVVDLLGVGVVLDPVRFALENGVWLWADGCNGVFAVLLVKVSCSCSSSSGGIPEPSWNCGYNHCHLFYWWIFENKTIDFGFVPHWYLFAFSMSCLGGKTSNSVKNAYSRKVFIIWNHSTAFFNGIIIGVMRRLFWVQCIRHRWNK